MTLNSYCAGLKFSGMRSLTFDETARIKNVTVRYFIRAAYLSAAAALFIALYYMVAGAGYDERDGRLLLLYICLFLIMFIGTPVCLSLAYIAFIRGRTIKSSLSHGVVRRFEGMLSPVEDDADDLETGYMAQLIYGSYNTIELYADRDMVYKLNDKPVGDMGVWVTTGFAAPEKPAIYAVPKDWAPPETDTLSRRKLTAPEIDEISSYAAAIRQESWRGMISYSCFSFLCMYYIIYKFLKIHSNLFVTVGGAASVVTFVALFMKYKKDADELTMDAENGWAVINDPLSPFLAKTSLPSEITGGSLRYEYLPFTGKVWTYDDGKPAPWRHVSRQ